MTGFGQSPVTTTQTALAANQIPISSVAVPGNTNGDLTALEGGPISTDSNSNKTAPASMYVKDGNDLTQGLTTDTAVVGDTTGTVSAKLRGLSKLWNDVWDSVNHRIKVDGSGVTQPVQQADLTATGTISAAQPVIGTPVAGATVQLALAQGQSTFKIQVLAGGGGFTSSTTIVVDKSLDGGTTWMVSGFKVGGSVTNTTVQSIVGPGPLELTGNASAVTHVRVRCSILNSTETIAVTVRGGAGLGDIGLISSIPAGKNTIGNTSALAGYIALTSPPANTNAASDTTLTFPSQVNHFMIQNNTSVVVYTELDTAASTGSILLVPGAIWRDDIQATTIHLYTVAAQPINTANGIAVKGWA